jgi:DNA-binding CsgD family transcriptional regulator
MIEVQPLALTRLGQSVGTSDFYEACLALMAELVSQDSQWIVVYSRIARPRTLRFELSAFPSVEIDRDLVLSTYELGFYRFDPFFRYWQSGGEPGVVGMHEIPVPPSKENTYLTDFMPITRMADDLAVFLPVSDHQCVALTVDRSTVFSGDEFALLRKIYPLFSGLNEAHLRASTWKEEREDHETPPTPLDFGSAVDSFTASGFTPRERDIVHLILGGFSNDAVARRIAIGVGTVRNHRKRIYAKLDITTERELFSLFMGHLADLDPSELI